MPEYIVEYIVVESRFLRLQADTTEAAIEEVKQFHAQYDSDRLAETVLITKCEEDK